MTAPLRWLWAEHGYPTTGDTFGPVDECSLCHTIEPVINIHKVVSSKFTDWDLYTSTPNATWCQACVWAHSSHDLRTYPWMASPRGCERLDQGRLGQLLNKPLAADVAVTLPVSRHKHLLPRARAGVITTDDAWLSWGDQEVAAATNLKRLRGYGFGENALSETMPLWAVLGKLSTPEQIEVINLWTNLDSWRQQPLLWAVILRATRKVTLDA